MLGVREMERLYSARLNIFYPEPDAMVPDHDDLRLPGDRIVHMPDGRQLAWREYGALSGRPLYFCHGIPGCRLEGRYLDTEARRAGWRIIAVDRSGIGLSGRQPGKTLEDDAADLAWLATHLGLEQFAVMGWSSGAPVALACAWAFPDRLTACFAVSGYTDFSVYPDGRDLLLETGWPLPKLAHWSKPLFYAVLALGVWLARVNPGWYFRSVLDACGEADQRVLSAPDHQLAFLHDQIEALRSPLAGIADNLRTQHGFWGFPLAGIRFPVDLVQGLEDRLVPPVMADHLHWMIPRSRLHRLPHYGHLLPLDEAFQRTVFDTLNGRVARSMRP
ncbi:MAG: alpha/beta hydrolase [Gammaproteobacteria bacterium]|nr:MAG: alpha/beta hydrolase [Gammaproteobacteria bacterium]